MRPRLDPPAPLFPPRYLTLPGFSASHAERAGGHGAGVLCEMLIAACTGATVLQAVEPIMALLEGPAEQQQQ